jgi:hypothetical protein
MRLRARRCTVAIWIAISGAVTAQAAVPAGAPTPAALIEEQQGFMPIFNGRDLSSWQVIGADAWSVKDGVVHCSGKGAGWIRSDRQYRDFILRLEYKISRGGNSGIFLRAAAEGDPWVSGMEIQVLDDYGEQPDIHSAGALYGVRAPAANASKPAGQWNSVEITCWGDDLTVSLNGRQLYALALSSPAINAKLPDDRKLTKRPQVGYIGLQNHSAPVEYRNVRVSEGFAPLFNGRDLSGWQVMGDRSWSVKDGAIACSGEGHGWLRSDAQYRDFTLRLEYKVARNANSGIFLRARTDGDPAFTGMEVQVLDDYGEPPDKHSNGALYDAVAPAVNPSKPAGEWNQVEITLWGDELTVFENGHKLYAVNLSDPALNAAQPPERKFPNRAPVGYIGLQNHGCTVEYRNLRIREGFVPMFNGENLAGWRTAKPGDESWSVHDGELVCRGGAGGYIFNTRRHGDFALRLQYQVRPRGNSGVFLRVSDIRNFHSGREIQILDSRGQPLRPSSAGAIYGVAAPSKDAARPAGEWNRLEITCEKARLAVTMNGEQVADVALADYPKLAALPPTGFIGLQNHHSPVRFRDIMVKAPSWRPDIGGQLQ